MTDRAMKPFANEFGEGMYNVALTVDEYDEIIDSLHFAALNDPECDREFNKGVRKKMILKRKHARKREREAS